MWWVGGRVGVVNEERCISKGGMTGHMGSVQIEQNQYKDKACAKHTQIKINFRKESL